MSKVIRTRVAPSPTGYPHIGTIYQAMFDYVLAKKYQGQFIVRIEDTDRNRFLVGSEKVIFDSLKWFGLEADEDPEKSGPYAPYRQSERLPLYKKYADELIKKGHAYYCFCTPERLAEMRKKQEAEKKPPMYDKHCLNLSKEEVAKNLKEKMPHVIRMKIPENQMITFTDALVGKVEFDSNLIDHQVLIKSDGFPTYHLAVVVDDYEMKISHIIRGREWIPSTPKHILLYQYFGWDEAIPTYIHVPLILNADGRGKLSKRDGHASVDYYRQEGFLPEAILNYLSNIVWNHPLGKEIYPLKELELAIDINSAKVIDLSSQAPRFDLQKLRWMNGEYIRLLSDEELTKRLQEFLIDHPQKEMIAPLVPLIKERIKTLSEFVPMTQFIFSEPEYDVAIFESLKITDLKAVLTTVVTKLESLGGSWQADKFENTFRQLAEELDIRVGVMFQLLRVAVSGQLVTPPLYETIQIMGQDKALARIKKVAENYPNL
jgi:glutamyl-tRNA synthetase